MLDRKKGNLWLYGGEGYDANGQLGLLGDLWEFNPSLGQNGEWTWMGGSTLNGQPGVYGTLGEPAATNNPGARGFSMTWSDGNGRLWLFGGYGYDANGNSEDFNDLWVFDPSLGQYGEWTWMGGGNTGGQSGNYGTSELVAMQWLMLLLSSAVVLASGSKVATLWANVSFLRMSWLLLYHILTAHALWPAPIYCWLLLVSGWPRRAAFLWAALPLVAIAGVEQIVFHTWHFAALVGSRFIGAAPMAASTSPDMFPTDPMTHIDLVGFLSSPGLWIGLAVAAVFLAAAVRLRRYQGPI